MSILRWPGGNFASGYNWKDGIGPKDQRPARPELAWNDVETNRFGTDEFLRYAETIKAEPYICINLGLGTIDDARDWVEYTNSTKHTYWADQRRKNGRDRALQREVLGARQRDRRALAARPQERRGVREVRARSGQGDARRRSVDQAGGQRLEQLRRRLDRLEPHGAADAAQHSRLHCDPHLHQQPRERSRALSRRLAADDRPLHRHDARR